jgi:hypothetical protein
MKHLIALGIVLSTAVATADTKTTEKAGSDESLQKGATGDRPWANGVPEAQQQAALVAFRDGNVQLNDGLFVKAAERYREALKHWDHPAIHYNLALALLNLDQPIEVYESLQKAIQYGATPLEKDKFEHAKEYLLAIQQSIADIEVSCDKPGAKVSVDGKEVFVAPGKYAARVRVGKHTFFADKAGYNTRITAPLIGPGEHFRIELKLYTAEELTRYHRKWDATWMPYTVMGAGALVGVIGGILELSAKSSFDDFDAKVRVCSSGVADATGCDATSLNRMRDRGNTKRTIGYAMYGVAGGAIIIGGVLAYLNRREPYQIRAEDLNEEHLSVTPMIAPGTAGAMVQGHF